MFDPEVFYEFLSFCYNALLNNFLLSVYQFEENHQINNRWNNSHSAKPEQKQTYLLCFTSARC